jgi:hypothetical protein
MQIKSDELTQMILDAYEAGRKRGREETLATVPPLKSAWGPLEPTIAPFATSEPSGIRLEPCKECNGQGYHIGRRPDNGHLRYPCKACKGAGETS